MRSRSRESGKRPSAGLAVVRWVREGRDSRGNRAVRDSQEARANQGSRATAPVSSALVRAVIISSVGE